METDKDAAKVGSSVEDLYADSDDTLDADPK